MLSNEQLAVPRDIGQSIAFADNEHSEVEHLIVEGYVFRNRDLCEPHQRGLKLGRSPGRNLPIIPKENGYSSSQRRASMRDASDFDLN